MEGILVMSDCKRLPKQDEDLRHRSEPWSQRIYDESPPLCVAFAKPLNKRVVFLIVSYEIRPAARHCKPCDFPNCVVAPDMRSVAQRIVASTHGTMVQEFGIRRQR